MRAAVILAALAIKSLLWFRTMTRTERCVVIVCAIILIIFAFTMRRHEEVRRIEIICSDPPQRQINFDYELCEWKLRDARSRHPAAMRPLIG